MIRNKLLHCSDTLQARVRKFERTLDLNHDGYSHVHCTTSYIKEKVN